MALKKNAAPPDDKHVSLFNNRRERPSLGSLVYQYLFYNIRDWTPSLLHHNIPEGKEGKYIHKGFVFLSLLIQMLLHKGAQQLWKLGSKFEHFLNRKKTSDEESDEYVSFLGHLDPRIELDKEIKHGDARYYPSLAMMASKLVYENKSFIQKVVSRYWKMEFVDFYDCYNEYLERWATQAFIFRERSEERDVFVLAFRGTSAFEADDWMTDFDLSWCKVKGMGKTHRGFMSALGLRKDGPKDDNPLLDDDDRPHDLPRDDVRPDPKRPLAYYTIREKLREIIRENDRAKLIVTGHSLGGALAVLFPAILAYHGEGEMLDRLEAIYTYGQPRVGDAKFGEFMKEKLRAHEINYCRIVYGNDVVPTLPWNTLMSFKHFGPSIHFNSLYYGKIEEEEKEDKILEKGGHKMKKVLRILMDRRALLMKNLIMARLIAVWQVIRGLIIPWTAGPDYREGTLLMLIRVVFGIIIAEAVDHIPQDYVNAIRLASPDLFLHHTFLMYHY